MEYAFFEGREFKAGVGRHVTRGQKKSRNGSLMGLEWGEMFFKACSWLII